MRYLLLHSGRHGVYVVPDVDNNPEFTATKRYQSALLGIYPGPVEAMIARRDGLMFAPVPTHVKYECLAREYNAELERLKRGVTAKEKWEAWHIDYAQAMLATETHVMLATEGGMVSMGPNINNLPGRPRPPGTGELPLRPIAEQRLDFDEPICTGYNSGGR